MLKVVFSILVIGLSFHFVQASEVQAIETKIVLDLGQQLKMFKSPQELLAKMKPRLNEKELKYFNDLIAKKMWIELPASIKSEGSTLILEFSNNVLFKLEVTDYWNKSFKLNDYVLNVDNYATVEEQMAYLRRVVKAQVVEKHDSKGALLSLMFPRAHASMTCNALVTSGCIEVSLSASLWFVKTMSGDSPLARCQEIYYFNKLNDITKKCLQDFKGNQTLVTIQDLSEILAQSPETSVEIECGRSEGPRISIGGKDVIKSGRGLLPSDYTIMSDQDPRRVLARLPELAIQCCKKHKEDPLAGKCEEFVSNQLGSREKRNENFKNPDLRLRGKAVPGVK